MRANYRPVPGADVHPARHAERMHDQAVRPRHAVYDTSRTTPCGPAPIAYGKNRHHSVARARDRTHALRDTSVFRFAASRRCTTPRMLTCIVLPGGARVVESQRARGPRGGADERLQGLDGPCVTPSRISAGGCGCEISVARVGGAPRGSGAASGDVRAPRSGPRREAVADSLAMPTRVPPDEVEDSAAGARFERLASQEDGLTDGEATRRLAVFGRNEIPSAPGSPSSRRRGPRPRCCGARAGAGRSPRSWRSTASAPSPRSRGRHRARPGVCVRVDVPRRHCEAPHVSLPRPPGRALPTVSVQGRATAAPQWRSESPRE